MGKKAQKISFIELLAFLGLALIYSHYAIAIEEDVYEYIEESKEFKDMEIETLKSESKDDDRVIYLKKDFIVNVTFKDTKKHYAFEYDKKSRIKEVTK